MQDQAVSNHTPLPVIANVSRVVSSVVDRICGDRVDFPLLVATAVVEALKNHGVQARVMYGRAAWLEVLEDQSVFWAGCWGDNFTFWAATQFGEVVDLNTSVAYRKRAHSNPNWKAMYSAPMLWSMEVPKFYRYIPDGVAELELNEDSERKKLDLVLREVNEKCRPELVKDDESFPNEPILCPGRRLLDDSRGSFKLFDRAVGVAGIPPAPI